MLKHYIKAPDLILVAAAYRQLLCTVAKQFNTAIELLADIIWKGKQKKIYSCQMSSFHVCCKTAL